MLSHISLGVSNLERSAKFYDTALLPLGMTRVWENDHGIGYGPKGSEDQLAIFDESDANARLSAGPGFHLAFKAQSREAVDQFYRSSIANGGTCDGEPGLRTRYSPTYYAAFVVDPDGHRIEAVFQ